MLCSFLLSSSLDCNPIQILLENPWNQKAHSKAEKVRGLMETFLLIRSNHGLHWFPIFFLQKTSLRPLRYHKVLQLQCTAGLLKRDSDTVSVTSFIRTCRPSKATLSQHPQILLSLAEGAWHFLREFKIGDSPNGPNVTCT